MPKQQSRKNNAIQVHHVGGVESLEWQPADLGEPAAQEVLIRQKAIGVNTSTFTTGRVCTPFPYR